MFQATSTFGPDGARLVESIDRLGLPSSKTRYAFMANEEFARISSSNLKRGMQIYWGEILARAHLAAATAILRSRRWIDGVLSAEQDRNLLSFAAALRGLIESAADASTSLIVVPETLARDHDKIVRYLSGDDTQDIRIVPELEEKLIHFSSARHLTKAERQTVPSSHNALQVREYIDILEKGQIPGVVECYSTLCDLTHPGASSVSMWLKPINDSEFDLAADQDGSVITYFLTQYQKTFLELLMLAFNPAIVTLCILNYFPLTQFHTSRLLDWDLSRIPAWEKCRNSLRGLSPQVGA